MEAKILRKPVSFRLREDLLASLKEKAVRANRTLNNYVENILLNDVCSEEPNELTKKAIMSARTGSRLPEEVYESVSDLMSDLMKE